MKRVAILMGVWLLLVQPAYSQLTMTVRGQPVTITFNSTLSGVSTGQYDGTGFLNLTTPSTGKLSSRTFAINGFSSALNFNGTATTGVLANGLATGAVNKVGVFAGQDGVGNANRFLLLQGDGTTTGLNPGYLGIKISNNVGRGIIGFELSYKIKVRNDKDTADSFNLSYSPDDITYTDVPSLNYTTPTTADSDPSVNNGFITVNRSTVIYSNIDQGGVNYLRFYLTRVSGTGESDEIGIDDITITALPEPSTYALMTLGIISVGYYTHWSKRRRNNKILSK